MIKNDIHYKGWFHERRFCKVCKERQWHKENESFMSTLNAFGDILRARAEAEEK